MPLVLLAQSYITTRLVGWWRCLSLLVVGQPQQQRQGQQKMDTMQSHMSLHSLQGRHRTSEKQPMVLAERG